MSVFGDRIGKNTGKSDEEKAEALSQWLARSAISLQGGTEIGATADAGLGLKAEIGFARDAEDAAVTVPRELVLSNTRVRELAEEDGRLKQWISCAAASGTEVLHLGLLYLWLEKQDNPWREYLDSLPSDVGLPYSLSVKEMEGLGAAQLSVMYPALSRRLVIERAYERFVKQQRREGLSLEQWLLPYQWISSRGVAHPKTGEVCVVPIVDLANHSSRHANARYDINEAGDFVLLKVPWRKDAQRPSSGTEDLLLDYGDRSSAEFVYNYGFLPEEHSTDDFEEVFRVFDPSAEVNRDVLDPSRASKDVAAEERRDLAAAYDVLIEFFAGHEQFLRLVRLPKTDASDEDASSRYKFHNNFIMALASQDELEVVEDEEGEKELYVHEAKLTPTSAFEAILKTNDKKIVRYARQLVSRMCGVLQKQLSQVPENAPAVYKTLAARESELYEHFANTVHRAPTPPPPS